MIIPRDQIGNCVLYVHIGGCTVAGIIRDVNGAELRVSDKLQYVVLANGTHLVPFRTIEVNSFTEEGIDILGTDVAAEIRTSILYKKEKGVNIVLGSCVSFVIPADPDANIILNLTLGRRLATKLTEVQFA